MLVAGLGAGHALAGLLLAGGAEPDRRRGLPLAEPGGADRRSAASGWRCSSDSSRAATDGAGARPGAGRGVHGPWLIRRPAQVTERDRHDGRFGKRFDDEVSVSRAWCGSPSAFGGGLRARNAGSPGSMRGLLQKPAPRLARPQASPIAEANEPSDARRARCCRPTRKASSRRCVTRWPSGSAATAGSTKAPASSTSRSSKAMDLLVERGSVAAERLRRGRRRRSGPGGDRRNEARCFAVDSPRSR